MHFGWVACEIDINNAFLDSDFEDIVLMCRSLGFEDPTKLDFVSYLCKFLYGLK